MLYEQFLERGAAGQGDGAATARARHRRRCLRIGPAWSEQFQSELARLGFVLEPFGGTSYMVRGVPVELGGAATPARLTAMLEECWTRASGRAAGAPTTSRRRWRVGPPIKAGQPLDARADENICWTQLAEADNPFACPHGRPIVIELGRLDLERRFGRR